MVVSYRVQQRLGEVGLARLDEAMAAVNEISRFEGGTVGE